jgi:hypothetical protein
MSKCSIYIAARVGRGDDFSYNIFSKLLKNGNLDKICQSSHNGWNSNLQEVGNEHCPLNQSTGLSSIFCLIPDFCALIKSKIFKVTLAKFSASKLRKTKYFMPRQRACEDLFLFVDVNQMIGMETCKVQFLSNLKLAGLLTEVRVIIISQVWL